MTREPVHHCRGFPFTIADSPAASAGITAKLDAATYGVTLAAVAGEPSVTLFDDQTPGAPASGEHGLLVTAGSTSWDRFRPAGLPSDAHHNAGTATATFQFRVDDAVGGPIVDIFGVDGDWEWVVPFDRTDAADSEPDVRLICDAISYHACLAGVVSSQRFLGAAVVSYSSTAALSLLAGMLTDHADSVRHQFALHITAAAAAGRLAVSSPPPTATDRSRGTADHHDR